jgi:hypothetical protein
MGSKSRSHSAEIQNVKPYVSLQFCHTNKSTWVDYPMPTCMRRAICIVILSTSLLLPSKFIGYIVDIISRTLTFETTFLPQKRFRYNDVAGWPPQVLEENFNWNWVCQALPFTFSQYHWNQCISWSRAFGNHFWRQVVESIWYNSIWYITCLQTLAMGRVVTNCWSLQIW